MQNFIKLFLLASGLAIMLLYPMGNLLLILPPNVVLAPFNYLQTFGIEASFSLGFLIAIIVLLILAVPQRYPSEKGFIILAIGLLSYIIFQIFKSEITLYAFNHQTRHSYNLKYLIEFMIFLLNGIGLGFIYHSNMPRQIEQWKGKKS